MIRAFSFTAFQSQFGVRRMLRDFAVLMTGLALMLASLACLWRLAIAAMQFGPGPAPRSMMLSFNPGKLPLGESLACALLWLAGMLLIAWCVRDVLVISRRCPATAEGGEAAR